jgi:hypothetical protein
MVAPIKNRRVVCSIIRIAAEEFEPADAPAETLGAVALRVAERVGRYAADPLVATLVSRLKSDSQRPRMPVKKETAAPANRISRFYADLEPPSPAFDPDWEWRETPRWDFDDESPYDDNYWWD